MYRINSIFLAIAISFLVSFNLSAQDRKTVRLIHKVEKKLKKWDNYFSKWNSLGKMKIDSVYVIRKEKIIQIFFNKNLSYIPVREKIIDDATISLKKKLGRRFRKYDIKIFTGNTLLFELIPNIYREKIAIDSLRFSHANKSKSSIITKEYPLKPEKGLLYRNLAIWHSHGKYYEAKLDRWEWQRARLHSTVEDVFPMTFVLDYIEPMLENAGANVFIPRERDINPNEIIIDNDYSFGKSKIEFANISIERFGNGFIWKDTLFENENPFAMGTYLSVSPKSNEGAFVKYIPEILVDGEYAVYIAYKKSNSKVKYSIHYSGGIKDFIINQNQGGSTWIYLGKFFFKKGIDSNSMFVEVSSKNKFSIDAIKFGGGMGNVARRPSNEIAPNAWSLKGKKKGFQNDKNQDNVNPNDFNWKLSGVPRYLESARYYLQYSGMPDSMVYSLSVGKSDYNDDYKSRGEWVNYLMGSPNGPTEHNDITGLGIPIDMALAFHTDAGVTPNDSIIGTLAIYNSNEPEKQFPSGQSKMANRDLVDIIQTQIVNDIRALHNPNWTRRGIWNKPYSEAWRANTPMMLLELLSHQNLADMKFGLNHKFKFDVSRAIYKGILKFLAFQDNREFVVQPLPIDHFAIQLIKNKTIKLSWSPVLDPLEESAKPEAYMIYKRIDGEGFDSGILVNDTVINLELEDYKTLYSFKIIAINKGGESFPSEILSVGINKNKPIALVVNAFDRIESPAIDSYNSGFDYLADMGVSYKHEIGLTGAPYELDRKVTWEDDDNPGWGASFSDWEGKEIAGNSFDYPLVHGKAILNAEYSFISTSDEAFKNKKFDISPYIFIDIIFGEEKTVKTRTGNRFKIFDEKMIEKITEITLANGNILLSGAYIGTDLNNNKYTKAIKFAKEVLHYKWRTNFASKLGEVYSTDYSKSYFNISFKFNVSLNSNIYKVEAPDGIEPIGKEAVTAFRYQDTGISAGIIYKNKYKVVALGFPFETIKSQDKRNALMRQIIKFYN